MKGSGISTTYLVIALPPARPPGVTGARVCEGPVVREAVLGHRVAAVFVDPPYLEDGVGVGAGLEQDAGELLVLAATLCGGEELAALVPKLRKKEC